MNSTLLRNILLPIGDQIFGQRMTSRIKFLEEAQWWEKDRIERFQREQLEKLITLAYHEVSFYKEMFDNASVSTKEVKEPQDLLKLPSITKDMLRKNYPARTTRTTGQKTYAASTSGATGKNFYVSEDAETAGWYRATFMLALEWAGWKIGEPHFQTGMTLQRSLDRNVKDLILGCHYFSAYTLDDKHLEMMLEVIERQKIKYIFGYPGSLYYLAKYARKNGWNWPIKSAVTWGDMLFPHYRKEIEEAFQTKVYDTYGCGEGMQIAAQCEYGNYHIHAFDVILEILDDEGKPVKEGETGNIIVTRLHAGPMPLIRYSIGDLGIRGDGSICPCGRNLPLLKSIQGRNTDVVITPAGNRLIVHFFTGVLEHFNVIDSFQIIQNDPDSIDLLIVPKETISEDLCAVIVRALKEKGANDLEIRIKLVDQIPLTSAGKNRIVINNIGKDAIL